MKGSRGLRRRIWAAAILAFVVSLATFGLQGRVGLNLADESYLWYGAQRVVAGEIPIRDFRSYDPGRYYWVAVFMLGAGDSGIVTLRGALAVFEFAGMLAALTIIATAMPHLNVPYLAGAALTLSVWMFPRYKIFDLSQSVFLVAALGLLVQKPSFFRFFSAGVVIGLGAFMGRNHGVYGLVAGGTLAVCFWLRGEMKDTLLKGIAVGLLGILVGYLPALLMVAGIRGFGSNLWRDVLFLFESGTTNLTLPIPWPWTVSLTEGALSERIRGMLVGVAFFCLFPLAVAGLLRTLWRAQRGQEDPAFLVAAAVAALPYIHYTYSRASLLYIAHGIFPILIATLSWVAVFRARAKWSVLALLLGVSAYMSLPGQPRWQCFRGQNCQWKNIGNDQILLANATAEAVTTLDRLVQRFAPRRPYLASWPGAYAALNRKAPVWETYALLPRSPSFEELEIDRMRNTQTEFAMIYNAAGDGREELRYRNSHPMMYRYLLENFDRLGDLGQDPRIELFLKKDATQ